MYMYYIYMEREGELVINMIIEIGMQPGYHDYNGYIYVCVYTHTRMGI
jgi:hypothetical protein